MKANVLKSILVVVSVTLIVSGCVKEADKESSLNNGFEMGQIGIETEKSEMEETEALDTNDIVSEKETQQKEPEVVTETQMETESEKETQVETETESQEPIHEHNYVEKITKEASCEKIGLKTYLCDCGEAYEEEIKAVGHKYGNYVYNNDATTEKDGTQTAVCSVCKKEKTIVAEGTKIEPSLEVNEFRNDLNYAYDLNSVSVKPKHVYWQDGKLYAQCFVINGLGQTVYNVNIKGFRLSNESVNIAEASFGVLSGVSIAPYSYIVRTFVFPADCIITPDADLSSLISYSSTSYAY